MFLLRRTRKHSITGDIYGLLSAISFGLFTGKACYVRKWYENSDAWLLTDDLFQAVLLKKFAGSEGHKGDVQKLFGYIGLFSLVGLWWLGKWIIILP